MKMAARKSPPSPDLQLEEEAVADLEGEPLEELPPEEEYVQPEGTVQYVGEFGAREITASEWEKAGIAEQPAVRWDSNNDFTLPKEGFTEHALRALYQDGSFSIT
jgi:hypothetical protein